MTDNLTVLKKARELITPEKAWIKHRFFQDEDGVECWKSSKPPVCFCLLGALIYANGHDVHEDEWLSPIFLATGPAEIIAKLLNEEHEGEENWTIRYGGTLGNWQNRDEVTHDEVLRILDKAIDVTEALGL